MQFFQKSPRCALIGAWAVNRANTVIAPMLKSIRYMSLFMYKTWKVHLFFQGPTIQHAHPKYAPLVGSPVTEISKDPKDKHLSDHAVSCLVTYATE